LIRIHFSPFAHGWQQGAAALNWRFWGARANLVSFAEFTEIFGDCVLPILQVKHATPGFFVNVRRF
jgi:hypothetical protein